MKRVFYFFFVLSVMIVVSVSCKHRNPIDDPKEPNDSTILLLDTDSLPLDTIVIPTDTDTIPLDTIPQDTAIVDTMIVDTDGLVHRLFLSDFWGVINVDETGFQRDSVRVELAPSDSTEGKLKMILYQVSFDAKMPIMDIMLENVSTDDYGNVWCDSIAPMWMDMFGTGFNMPVADYMVNTMRGTTYYDPLTQQVFYSTQLDIRNVGVARYLGSNMSR